MERPRFRRTCGQESFIMLADDRTQVARAPFQVLIFPFHRTDSNLEYAIFRRADAGYWQGVAGGGEGEETPLEAARREAKEEAGISPESPFTALDAVSNKPVEHVGTL